MRTTMLGVLTAIAVLMPTARQATAVEPESRRLSATQAAGARPQSVRPLRDSSIPMISMTFVQPGHFDVRRITPDVAIYADGRVSVTADARSSQTIDGHLPRDEWLRVQQELFVENRLMACETTVLKDDIMELRCQRRRPVPGPDAAVTVITIRGEGVDQEIRCHAVGLTATQLPDLQDVQNLHACQQCLQNVVKVVRAGGYEQVRQTLETVNERLKRQLPDAGPLSSQDLNLVDARPDGTRYLQFSRLPRSTGSSGTLSGLQGQDRYLMVSVYERPGRPLEISIIGDTATQ